MKKIAILIAAMLVLLFAFTACADQRTTENETEEQVSVSETTDKNMDSTVQEKTEEPKITAYTSIYSWNRELFELEPADVFAKLSDYGINRCYQGLYPTDLTGTYDVTAQVVKKLRVIGIEPVYLVSGAEWDKPETAKAWSVDLLSTYNANVASSSRIYSIAFDNEFYRENDSVEGFRQYADNMKIICDYAHENGFTVINILPYWLPDKYGADIFKKVLAFSDEISIMCYYRDSEIENLKTITDLCSESGVKAECVFETQKPDGKDILEINTYYNQGRSAVIVASDTVKTAYPGISIGYHALTNMLDWQ